MQRGLFDRRAVRPSACLSITRVYYDKTNKSSADIIIPCERKIHLLFRAQGMVDGVPLPEILGQTDPPSFKRSLAIAKRPYDADSTILQVHPVP